MSYELDEDDYEIVPFDLRVVKRTYGAIQYEERNSGWRFWLDSTGNCTTTPVVGAASKTALFGGPDLAAAVQRAHLVEPLGDREELETDEKDENKAYPYSFMMLTPPTVRILYLMKPMRYQEEYPTLLRAGVELGFRNRNNETTLMYMKDCGVQDKAYYIESMDRTVQYECWIPSWRLDNGEFIISSGPLIDRFKYDMSKAVADYYTQGGKVLAFQKNPDRLRKKLSGLDLTKPVELEWEIETAEVSVTKEDLVFFGEE